MFIGRNEIVFDLVPEHRLCRFFGRGLIGLPAVIEGIAVVNQHPDFRPDFSSLVCFEEATVSFGEGDLEHYRQFLATHLSGRQGNSWALVAGDDITVSTARLANLLSDNSGLRFRIFPQRAEALAWLGLPAELGSRPAPWSAG